MTYKLVARTIECTADSDPNVKWDSKYVGVIDSNIPSQKTARIMWDAVALPYAMMCGAIGEFIDVEYGESVLGKVFAAETASEEIEAEGHAYNCWLNKEGVTFEFQFGENGPEKGGEVTLAQFKLAVQTYLQFLRDPERKPIEVPFPE